MATFGSCYCKCKDTIFFSNSQPPAPLPPQGRCCYCKCKDTIFFSNSQPKRLDFSATVCCYCKCKDTIFFSNSQLCAHFLGGGIGCYCKCKDTIFFQQFTTCTAVSLVVRMLLLQMQRYNFFSNSQQKIRTRKGKVCCYCKCKDTIFLAIHNRDALMP